MKNKIYSIINVLLILFGVVLICLRIPENFNLLINNPPLQYLTLGIIIILIIREVNKK